MHGAYQIGMSRLSCALCVLGSRQDLVTAARANRALVDEYATVEDDVEATFQNGTSVREIGAEADRLGPLELPAPASLEDLEAAAEVEPSSEPAVPRAASAALPRPSAARPSTRLDAAFWWSLLSFVLTTGIPLMTWLITRTRTALRAGRMKHDLLLGHRIELRAVDQSGPRRRLPTIDVDARGVGENRQHG